MGGRASQYRRSRRGPRPSEEGHARLRRDPAQQRQEQQPKPEPKSGTPRVWLSAELAGATPLDWLGARHIPESAVTLLTGDEGIGKSLLWVWIAAAITTGSALPEFGIPERDPRHVLVIVTEDDWSSVVRPRLELAGADMDYVSVLCSEPDGSGSPGTSPATSTSSRLWCRCRT